jgi:hypothetical protein
VKPEEVDMKEQIVVVQDGILKQYMDANPGIERNGIKLTQISNSNKFEISVLNSNGKIDAYDAPLHWISEEVQLLLSSGRVEFWTCVNVIDNMPIFEKYCTEGLSHIELLLLLIKDRSWWIHRFKTMILHPTYRIKAVVKSKFYQGNKDKFIKPTLYTRGIGEEAATDGFYSTEANDSIAFIYKDGKIFSNGSAKKSITRLAKQCDNATGIPYGTFKLAIMHDVTEPMLSDATVGGNCVMPQRMVMELGMFRAISRGGLKVTNSIMTDHFEDVFGDVCVVGGNGWKFHFMGIVDHWLDLNGFPKAEMLDLTDELLTMGNMVWLLY